MTPVPSGREHPESELKAQTENFFDGVGLRYSKSSLRAYRAGLRRFQSFADELGIESAAEVNESVLVSYHSWLLMFPLSESTVSLAIRSAKLFLKWAAGAGLTLYDGSSYRLKDPKTNTPEPPTVAVMQRLLELPNQKTPEGLRDLFVLELLYGLGLRRTEVCTRGLGDLDLSEETLFVRGKNGDERLLPVGLRLKSVAQDYLFKARPKLFPAANETALLLSREGRRLEDYTIFYIVKKYGEMLDLKLSPHVLRHACATHLVEGGMKLTDIQRLLGHRDIGSTKRYTQISQSEMDREFRRTHPRSKRD